ncbi:type I methionyl aminopeptidase [Candidatus Jorgensenbacteria bacterium CG23_combo_of_CG06-09_8_20_14_all_54_14]|uniref:Methionine aminopeptidase n=1 Tax=Candidatus Jorgensenbacteria bacterium CG23_combo_of_CG06-09_8_20_14_all_54_14 TaxID=1974595 RepID=A0A2G9Z9C4_9BACT|nr:MAG: type I methionyl aminopeptidase [Candidatus Jorgensenbacteria bacterium CG23_combo_of_CG06-09_8_20_14_all_54_14]
MKTKLKSEGDIKLLRASGRVLAELLALLKKKVKPGVVLSELDSAAREYLKKAGARPAFLRYQPEGALKPFPAAICTSVNEQIVHGIPSAYKLVEGDILKIDAGVDYKGYFTDAAITVPVGRISKRAEHLVRVTSQALQNAIRAAKLGGHLGDIGAAVTRTLRGSGFRAVRGLTGHGVGFALHEDPTVFNYGTKGEGMVLRPGLVLAIEPMISAGSPEIDEQPDGSYTTRDGSLAAHFEHTVAITERGPEILTR